jgi:hypothetical protein
MKKEAYYFSHDANAKDDPKILQLRMEMGWEGYGLFWALIEMLRNESDHRMQKHYKSIAFALHTNEESIKKLVNDFDLFGTDDQFFWSESLLKRMELKEAKSEKMRNAANKRWNKDDDAQAMQMHSKSNAEAMQLKESKVNKTKENLNEISSIDIFTTSRLGGKNLFQEMAYIYDLNDEQVQKLYQEWDLTHDDQTFESERHLKNSFILFVKNNASRFKQSKPAYQKSKSEYKSENVFSKLLAEEIEKENQTKP